MAERPRKASIFYFVVLPWGVQVRNDRPLSVVAAIRHAAQSGGYVRVMDEFPDSSKGDRRLRARRAGTG